MNSRLVGQLESAKQRLTDEMKRLLGAQGRRRNDAIGGIPVDSEYVIFIIDTSGSMFNYAWPRAQREMINILDLYPQVKGMQVMSDEGEYMFSSYRGQWIPDTPARRRAIVSRFATWNPYSNSSPVEGIVEAIRTFHEPGRRISLYVLGDEFTGSSIAQVIDVVDRINGESGGERLVRELVSSSQGHGWINTAYIERLNATFRQRLSCLARRSRQMTRQTDTLEAWMWLQGSVYNWCTVHQALATPLPLSTGKRRWLKPTPAIAAQLTDHQWTIEELMTWKRPIPPPHSHYILSSKP